MWCIVMCVVCVVLSMRVCVQGCVSLSLFLLLLPHCISHFTSDLLPCPLSLSARKGSRLLSRLTFRLMSCVSSDLDSFRQARLSSHSVADNER